MRWEKEHGLPVHRINKEAKKSKVIAIKADLDRWLLRGRPANEAPENKKSRIPRGRLWGIIAAAIVVVGGLIFVSAVRKAAPPAGYRVEGRILSIIDGEGRTKWTAEIPTTGDQSSFYAEKGAVDEKKMLERRKVVFLDADGDRKMETALFWDDDIPENRGVALYDQDGTRLWLRKIHNDVEYARTQWGNDFLPVQIKATDVDGDGRPEILALWNHRKECPGVFQVFSPEGEELGHYEHTGTFLIFAVRHRDDQAADILLGGTNNLLDGDAVLIGLDGRHLPNGLGPPYAVPEDLKDSAERLASFVPRASAHAQQAFYIRFRHNEISRGLGTQWIWPVGISPTSKRIDVELILGHNAFLNFYFGPDLALEDIRPGSDLIRAYPGWLARGFVRGSLNAFLYRCRRDVSYWDGGSWSALPPPERRP